LDLYQGQFDLTTFSTQVHDFDPGFSPNGLFWTMPLPPDNPLVINFEAGEATLIADLDLLDYTSIPNAAKLGPAVPAEVNYELRWSGPISRDFNFQDSDRGFRGRFLENKVTLAWSASRAGFKFVSDAANTSTNVFAELARESNGLFF
jgi:hypothetical protein